MGDSSVFMAKMPSNFRSGKGAVMLAEMRVRTLYHYQHAMKDVCNFQKTVPSLSQCHIDNAILLTE